MKKAYILFTQPRHGQPVEFYFTLHAKNGKLISTGETYTRKSNAKKSIENNFPDFKIIDTTKS